MKPHTFFSLIIFYFFIFSNTMYAQEMNLPLQFSPSYRVYLSTSGNDSNSGDSLQALASFSQALSKLNQLTSNLSGDVYTEVVLYEGTYFQALSQGYSQYQIGNKKLNVSVRGKGTVQLDGNPVSNISSGGGMVHLLGSNIYVRDLVILYSPANGVRFGYDYNGIEFNSHDIVVENVIVSSTLGHGILVGKGALNTINPLSLTPMAERFLIQNCEVKQSVNFNLPQNQWGSAVKAWNAKHVNIRNCLVHDNSGEGIDLDFCDSVAVYGNNLMDNYANVYFDKVTHGWIYNNWIQNDLKKSAGILCAIESFTGLISNYAVSDVAIYNNILLNTQGIHFWQGSYGANQQGYFHNIDVSHNTVIGHQTGSGSCLHFNYQTFLGQPVPNVSFQNIYVSRNIISAPVDSLTNGQLCNASLTPQVGLIAEYNVYNSNQVPWFNVNNDVVQGQLPIFANSITELTPSSLNPLLVYSAPLTTIMVDFLFNNRGPILTNVGAIEFNQNLGISSEIKKDFNVFPNPSNGKFRIGQDWSEKPIKVFDINGCEITNIIIDANGYCDLSNVNPGIYILQIGDKIVRIAIEKE